MFDFIPIPHNIFKIQDPCCKSTCCGANSTQLTGWLLGWLVGWPQKAEQLLKLAAAVSGAMENSTIHTFLIVRGQPSEPVTYFNLIGLQIMANF